jgi:putative toxin-antitoxin system antitoxin component (TIGR02293 family)
MKVRESALYRRFKEKLLKRPGAEEAYKKGRQLVETEIRYGKALERAKAVFENEEDALAWLREPSIPLGHVTPLSLLGTEEGLKLVLYELDQMEYGHPV